MPLPEDLLFHDRAALVIICICRVVHAVIIDVCELVGVRLLANGLPWRTTLTRER